MAEAQKSPNKDKSAGQSFFFYTRTTNPYSGLWLFATLCYIMQSCAYYVITMDLGGLLTPVIWSSCTVLRTENTDGDTNATQLDATQWVLVC